MCSDTNPESGRNSFSNESDSTAEVLPSVSKVAEVWRSLSWCLESVLLWRGIMGFTKFGDKLSMIWIWRSSCWMANCLWDRWTCHSLSNIEVCANASGNISKHQPARKRLKKSTLAASTLACCVSMRTNLKHTRNTRPIRQFTMAGTLQVAKLWHAGFSYVQTSSKPCSNLKSMGLDHASRWRQYFKGKFN